ncbi:MAG: hypothetical protein HRU17_11635 [Polyangiaceae bacterium]|nr:hypothetical protein [Polyangiaceae bacterium]
MSDEHTEAEEVLADDESPTPVWFTILGATLFLLAGTLALVLQDDPANEGDAAPSDDVQAAAAP